MDSNIILQDFAKAVAQLEKALSIPADSEVVQAGCIQYFEFCFELAWKSIKALGAEQGLSDCTSPKSCLRQAFSQGWIDDESLWLDMLMARNRMSHTYDVHDALRVYEALQSQYLPQFQLLLPRLQAVS